ncbi:MAG: TRAP transporter small permease [Burkholderiales bacterium]|nr:MAG: TRAP transporter small permease [Burkholderiales bacterium]
MTARSYTALDRVVDTLAVVAGAMLCALVLLISVDVVARASRLFSMPWTLDVAEYLLYALTFLGAPWVLREHGHIAIEIVLERLGYWQRRALTRVIDACGALVCATLLFYSARLFWRSYASGTLVYETFQFPEWWLYTLPPVVFLLLLVLFARRVLNPSRHQVGAPPSEGI